MFGWNCLASTLLTYIFLEIICILMIALDENLPQYINGLVQKRRNSIGNAMELRLSSTNPSTYCNK